MKHDKSLVELLEELHASFIAVLLLLGFGKICDWLVKKLPKE